VRVDSEACVVDESAPEVVRHDDGEMHTSETLMDVGPCHCHCTGSDVVANRSEVGGFSDWETVPPLSDRSTWLVLAESSNVNPRCDGDTSGNPGMPLSSSNFRGAGSISAGGKTRGSRKEKQEQHRQTIKTTPQHVYDAYFGSSRNLNIEEL